jgi:hypothetical protein
MFTGRSRTNPSAALLGLALLGALDNVASPEQRLRSELLDLAGTMGAFHGIPMGMRCKKDGRDPVASLETDVKESEERINRVLKQVQAKYDLRDESKRTEILVYALRELCLDLASACAEAMRA